MTMLFRSLLPLLPVTLALVAADAAGQCADQHLYASDATGASQFGSALATDFPNVIVGAADDDEVGYNAGAAYFLQVVEGELVELGKFLPPSAKWSQHFGQSVAIDGDWAVVGSTDHAILPFSGAAFVYRNTSSGWVHEDTLRAGVPVHGDHLGSSVAIEGNRIVVGAPGQSAMPGKVLVYERGPAGWQRTATIHPHTTTPRDFGVKVRIIDGRIAVVGRSMTAGEAGIYFYDLLPGGWTLVDELLGEVMKDWDGQRVVSGSIYGNPGYVEVFERNAGGWSLQQTLYGSGDSLVDFGASASLQGDRLVVGTQDSSPFFMGNEYVELFQFESGTWTSQGRYDPLHQSGSDRFGNDVAFLADMLVVGSTGDAPDGTAASHYAGGIHVFALEREFQTICQGEPNSTGQNATVDVRCGGSLTSFTLEAAPVPEGPGLFFYSANQTLAVDAFGLRCVGGPVQRMRMQVASNGVLASTLDPLTSAGETLLPPGSTWFFQSWYRDPAGSPSGALYSDAIRLLMGA